MENEKIDTLVMNTINFMLKNAGHDETIETVRDKTEWFGELTQTKEQSAQTKSYFIAEAKKLLRWSKKRSEHEYQWFDLMWGLKEV